MVKKIKRVHASFRPPYVVDHPWGSTRNKIAPPALSPLLCYPVPCAVIRTMLILFCFSAKLKDNSSIPPTEIAFYVFMGVSK